LKKGALENNNSNIAVICSMRLIWVNFYLNMGSGALKRLKLPVVFKLAASNLLPECAQTVRPV